MGSWNSTSTVFCCGGADGGQAPAVMETNHQSTTPVPTNHNQTTLIKCFESDKEETLSDPRLSPSPVDIMWTHKFYQLVSDNQTEPEGHDHILQLKTDGVVACDGYIDDKNTHLKVYKGIDISTREIVFLFEFINGPMKDNMIIIDNDKLSYKKKTHEFKIWSDADKDMKFQRSKRQDDMSSLLLLNSSPKEYIGFDGFGNALQPSQVNTDSKSGEAWFYFNTILA